MSLQPESQAFWVEHLDNQQQAALTKFRTILEGKDLLFDGYRDDITLCRFLKARRWDCVKALTMWEDMVKWRQQALQPVDPPFTEQEKQMIRQHYPHFYHKCDRHGRPVYYELLGDLNASELLKIMSVERLVKFHVLGWEYTKSTILTACSFAAQRDVFTCTTVLDLKGLKMSSFTKEVRAFICGIASVDQNYYPEHLGQMFIVNAPLLFSGIWSVVKPWLEERTRKKIQVVSSEKASCEVLAGVIPRENLLQRFGGDSVLAPPYDSDVGPWADSNLMAKALKSTDASSQSCSSMVGVAIDVQA